jgi:hypothetical protein
MEINSGRYYSASCFFHWWVLVVSSVTRWVIIDNHSLPYSGRVTDSFAHLAYEFRTQQKSF